MKINLSSLTASTDGFVNALIEENKRLRAALEAYPEWTYDEDHNGGGVTGFVTYLICEGGGKFNDDGRPSKRIPPTHKSDCARQSALNFTPSPWRSIEIAPRDGTLILLYLKKGDTRECTGFWHKWGSESLAPGDECWSVFGGGWLENDEVSHWMPIPEGPKGANND